MAEIVPRDRRIGAKPRTSPIDRMISEQDGTYYKMSEAAQILRVAPITLRRLLKDPDLNAPSHELRAGGIYVYLYTPEDLQELEARIRPKQSERT